MPPMADKQRSQFDFDFSKAKGPRATPVVGGDEAAAQAPAPWPVSLLVRHIKESLSECFPGAVSVVGENVVAHREKARNGQGHWRVMRPSRSRRRMPAVEPSASWTWICSGMLPGSEWVAQPLQGS